MASFKAYLKKEFLESIRTSRFIILLIGFGAWAIVNPVILKLLPVFLEGQLPVELIDTMVIDRVEALRNYMSDLFSLVNIFIIFTLMGIMADEVGRQKLMLPYSKGVNPTGLVLAKSVHYTVTVILMVLIGFLVNYYYSSILFDQGNISLAEAMSSALLFMVYFSFNVSLLIFISSIFRKGIITGAIVMVMSYMMPLLSNIQSIKEYIPYYLVQKAGDIGSSLEGTMPVILVTILAIVLMNIATVIRMKNIEVV